MLTPIGPDKDTEIHARVYTRVRRLGIIIATLLLFFLFFLSPLPPASIRRFLAARVTAQQRETRTRGFSHTVVIALDWPNNSGYAAIGLSFSFYPVYFPVFFLLSSYFSIHTARPFGGICSAYSVFLRYDLIVARVAKFALVRSCGETVAVKIYERKTTAVQRARARARSISASRGARN